MACVILITISAHKSSTMSAIALSDPLPPSSVAAGGGELEPRGSRTKITASPSWWCGVLQIYRPMSQHVYFFIIKLFSKLLFPNSDGIFLVMNLKNI